MLKNVPDEKILAITFTRKARREMVKRLNKAIPGNNFHIETFNSFCEKMLLKSGHLIYDKEHKVLDFKNKISLGNAPVPVWPDAQGKERGVALLPIHPSVIKALKTHPDQKFYLVLPSYDSYQTSLAFLFLIDKVS